MQLDPVARGRQHEQHYGLGTPRMFDKRLRHRLKRWQQSQQRKQKRSTQATEEALKVPSVSNPVRQAIRHWAGGQDWPPTVDDPRAKPFSDVHISGEVDFSRDLFVHADERMRSEGKCLWIERPLDELFPASSPMLEDWMARQDQGGVAYVQRDSSNKRSLAGSVDPSAPCVVPAQGVDPQGASTMGEIRHPKRDVVRDGVEAFRANFPKSTLFLDLETCGLAGSAIFLAGVIRWHNDRPTLTQIWARNYAE